MNKVKAQRRREQHFKFEQETLSHLLSLKQHERSQLVELRSSMKEVCRSGNGRDRIAREWLRGDEPNPMKMLNNYLLPSLHGS
jgi:hypothetical protein